MYGARGRIGLIVPSPNIVIEPEFYRIIPEGVSVCTTRVKLTEVTVEGLKKMATCIKRAAEELKTAKVKIIIYACTSGSFIGGRDWEAEIRKEIEVTSGIRALTSSEATVKALKYLGLSKIAVATPYTDEINRQETKFLEEKGLKVLGISGLGITKALEIGELLPSISYDLAQKVFLPAAEALFISCTNLRTIEVIEKLECELKVPVVTSNQASLWAVLRICGVKEPIEGYGRLMRMVTVDNESD